MRQLCEAASLAPLLGDLSPLYAVDEDKLRLELFASGRYAHNLPPVMGGSCGEAGDHLVPLSNLLLDVIAAVGEGGMIVSVPPQVILAVGLVAGREVMVDQVGGQHLL